MRQLFWKEWYELRLLPLASAVCVALLIWVAKAFNVAYDNNQHFTVEDTSVPLVGTWVICSLLAGASLIAQEVGSGGLQLLSALPIRRSRIWWVKVGTALGVLLLSAITSLLTWMVVDALVFRTAFFQSLSATASAPYAYVGGLALGLVVLSFFSMGLAVSPFLDRSISAVVAALLAGAAYWGTLQNLASQYVYHFGRMYGWQESDPHPRDTDSVLAILLTLSIPLLASISYWTFTRGETLRSAKRFRVGAFTGAISLAIAGLVFLAGFQMRLW